MLFYVGSFSYNFACHVLVYLGSFSCTLHASLYGQFLLHVLCCFMWEFLLHAPCCFMWGVSLTRLLLFYVGSFSYTPLAVLCGDFLLHTLCCFLWVVSLMVRSHDRRSLQIFPKMYYYASPTLRSETTSGLLVRLWQAYGPIGAQRPLTQVTWQVWAYWRAASTDSPHLTSSEYSLARLRADMTLSVHLSSTLGTKTCALCTFQCPSIAFPRTTLGLCTAS